MREVIPMREGGQHNLEKRNHLEGLGQQNGVHIASLPAL